MMNLGQRQSKPFETSLVLTELSLDNNFIRGELTQHKDVWIISGCNIPHPTDTIVSNPGIGERRTLPLRYFLLILFLCICLFM